MEGPTWILGDRAKWPNEQLLKAVTRPSHIVYLAQGLYLRSRAQNGYYIAVQGCVKL